MKHLSPTRWLTLAIFVVLSLVLPVSTARAATTVSFSVSPLIFELTANPGETLTNSIRVTNLGAEAEALTMDLEAFTGTETGEAVVTEKGDPAYSLKDWTGFSPSQFSLGANTSQVVTFTIKIPQDAEPGGRYGSLLAGSQSNQIGGGTGARTVQKIGSLILLNVRGPINYSASIKDFAPTKQIFEHSPISFTARIHNDSTVHIKPRGFVTISNMFGRKVADVPVPERNILPKSDRLLEIPYDKPLRIGRYTATLLVAYGDRGDQLTATATFMVFPWKVGLPIIAAVLLVLWFVIARRRNLAQAIRVLFGKS